LFPLFANGVVIAAGVIETGGNLPPVLLTQTANLLPVSLTPVLLIQVVHLDL
jgi:hypothetical protein